MTRLTRTACFAVLVAISGSGSACAKTPTEPDSGPAGRPIISSIEPTTGSTFGRTRVSLHGSGFQTHATVIVGGMHVEPEGIGSQLIILNMPAHTAGPVEVVVTDPKGGPSSLPISYTYVVVPPPVVTGVSPSVGSTRGGTTVTLTGTGFDALSAVTLGGVTVSPYSRTSTRMVFGVPAATRSAGNVDVEVTNLDGQAHRLPGAYTFALLETFDFNGDWEGYADDGSHRDTVIRFTIRGNVLIGASCGGPASPAPLVFSSAPIMTRGEFSLSGPGDISISGQLLSADQASGRIDAAPCASHVWGASRR